MSATIEAAPAGPLLRTLSPALRNLATHLRVWLDSPHPQTFGTIARASLEGAIADLQRKAEDLDVDRPHLVILFMGGTGVGKSTLLNALAGESIAHAAFTRPTTRDPIVYYHRSLRPDRLAPALRNCKLVAHERPELEHKVIVDTPDLDSNEPENRAKLEQLLPAADVVLYVGSQEKYHDRVGWQMFREQRKRRAFAFVLNKWDRCLHSINGGMRPDDDLFRDLAAEGFESPLLFRTAAQYWVDHASRNGEANPPPGEQFRDLVQWLELGLSRIEIEAVKARGVGQLLEQCSQALESVNPPEVSLAAEKTAAAWEPVLDDESEAFSDVLLTTLDPNQQEIEQHFRVEGQRRFRGILAWYLSLINRFQYVGARFRTRVPFVGGAEPQRAAVNLAGFTHECVRRASERSLDRRHESLAHKLLVEADDHGFPPDLLPGPVGEVSKRNWREQFETGLNDALSAVEQQWIRPSGPKAWMQMTLIWFCNYLPELTLVASIIVLFWGVFYEKTMPTMFMAFSPFFLTLLVLVLLQILINFVMPLRWPSIRGKFRRELVRQLRSLLHDAYLPVPTAVAESLKTERKRIADIRAEVDDVSHYLDQHQRASSVQGLYGS